MNQRPGGSSSGPIREKGVIIAFQTVTSGWRSSRLMFVGYFEMQVAATFPEETPYNCVRNVEIMNIFPPWHVLILADVLLSLTLAVIISLVNYQSQSKFERFKWTVFYLNQVMKIKF